MWLAVALFFAGAFEYIGAALWTRAVMANAIGWTSLTTFFNVLIWGFVVANIHVSTPGLLVIHGLGCATGAAATCYYGKQVDKAK